MDQSIILNWQYPYKFLASHDSCNYKTSFENCDSIGYGFSWQFPNIVNVEAYIFNVATFVIVIVAIVTNIYITKFNKAVNARKRSIIFRVSIITVIGSIVADVVIASINHFLDLYPVSRFQFLAFLMAGSVGILLLSLLVWFGYEFYHKRKQPEDFSEKIKELIDNFTHSTTSANFLIEEMNVSIKKREEDIKKSEANISDLKMHLAELAKQKQDQQKEYEEIKDTNQAAIKVILKDLDQNLEKRDKKSLLVNFGFLFLGAVLSWAAGEIIPKIPHLFGH